MIAVKKALLILVITLTAVIVFANMLLLVPAVQANSSYPHLKPSSIDIGGIGQSASGRLALAEFNSQVGDFLYLAWTGTDNPHHVNLGYFKSGLTNFTRILMVPSETSPAGVGPALAVFNGWLYLAWTGTDSAHHLNVMGFDGKGFNSSDFHTHPSLT